MCFYGQKSREEENLFGIKNIIIVIMKNYALKAERKVFPSFQLGLNPKSAILFVVESLLIFLFASVQDFGFALCLGLFSALCYARQNILALAPCFIAACCVFSLEWWTLLYAVSPVVVLTFLYLIFFAKKKNVPLGAVAIATLIGSTPFVVCNALFNAQYMRVALCALISLVFTFCAGIVAYAVLVRKTPNRSTVDEMICGGIFAAVFAYALRFVGAEGFFVYEIALAFVLMLSSTCLSANVTLCLAILFGIGASLATESIETLGGAVILGIVALSLSPFTKWSSAIGILCAQAISWVLNLYVGAGWQALVMSSIGVIAFLCIPKRVIARVQNMLANDSRKAYTGIVNRRGRDVANKLYHASDVFFETSKSLSEGVEQNSSFGASALAKDIASNYCGRCVDREQCFSALKDDTSSILKPLAQTALSRGKVTILDMSPFITSRCSRIHSLINVINASADVYQQKKEANECGRIWKKTMAEQFAGVALVLDSLARDCSRPVSFASEEVESLRCELLKHNVVASEIVVTSGDDCEVALTVRDSDAKKEVLAKIVSKAMRQSMQIEHIAKKGEQAVVHMLPSPVYEVAYGVAQKIRSQEGVCGDSNSISRPSRNQRIFAICDGMGSGDSAYKASQNALRMIESFYKSGIESDIVLTLVNKLLKLGIEDNFSTLDICAINTDTGSLDVIKLGAATSFIVRKDSVEVLSCSLPPMGILDDIQPSTSKYQLFDSDMVIMMSDGVFDPLDTKGVMEVVDELNTLNPQTLANGLLERAIQSGASDDCTVLVLRLFCN